MRLNGNFPFSICKPKSFRFSIRLSVLEGGGSGLEEKPYCLNLTVILARPLLACNRWEAHTYRVALHDGFCGCKLVVMKFSAPKLIRLRYKNYLNANSQPHTHTVTQPCIFSSTLRWQSRMTDSLELWGKIYLKGASKKHHE